MLTLVFGGDQPRCFPPSAQESYASMAKKGRLEPSLQLLQLEKMAINTALPGSPLTDLIPAYSGYSTPRSSVYMSRSTSSKLRNNITKSSVSHLARKRLHALPHVCTLFLQPPPFDFRGLLHMTQCRKNLCNNHQACSSLSCSLMQLVAPSFKQGSLLSCTGW